MLIKLEGIAKVKYTIEVDADSVEDAINQVDVHLQSEPGYTLEDMTILDAEMASEPEAKIVEAQFKVRVKGIDYDVEEQDVIDEFDVFEDPTDEEIEAKINEIKSKLPQVIEVDVECDPDELEDYIADAISDETGWLINSFDQYEILEQK